MLLNIENENGKIVKSLCGEKIKEELFYQYAKGDKLILEVEQWPIYLTIQLEEEIGKSIIYLTTDRMEFPIPYGEEEDAYKPGVFKKNIHRISVCKTKKEEYQKIRDISLNPWDRRGETSYYPHCYANVETRNESVFAARNTIDGRTENDCHGIWPYTSWGDNENMHAEIIIAFGRMVEINQINFLLRADFPHDNYWKKATLLFSDKSQYRLSFIKTKQVQSYQFSKKRASWVKLKNLVCSEEKSPFPALTNWQVVGKDINLKS